MKHVITRKFLFFSFVVISAALISSQYAVAEERGKAAAKSGKAATKIKKKNVTKSPEAETKGSTCVFNDKKWREGEHCMTTCNASSISCDMSICKDGNWKPYSSCFGPKAVSPNCPVSCG